MMDAERMRNENLISGAESIKKKYTMILNEYNSNKPSMAMSVSPVNKENKGFDEIRNTRVNEKEEGNFTGKDENVIRESKLSTSRLPHETENKVINEPEDFKKNIVTEENLK